MSFPYFYDDQEGDQGVIITLPEETSRHIVSVLRMKSREQLRLTNGRGRVLKAEIVSDHKKHCTVLVIAVEQVPPPTDSLCIAISLLKNANRFEWFLEKATEIGVTHIVPLICQRTEKQFFRSERMKGILTSAMLQSQQAWLPSLSEPLLFENFVTGKTPDAFSSKFIAHCLEQDRQQLTDAAEHASHSSVILIGPEGDFNEREIALALENGYVPVILGNNRLRTETAGVVAATILKLNSL